MPRMPSMAATSTAGHSGFSLPDMEGPAVRAARRIAPGPDLGRAHGLAQCLVVPTGAGNQVAAAAAAGVPRHPHAARGSAGARVTGQIVITRAEMAKAREEETEEAEKPGDTSLTVVVTPHPSPHPLTPPSPSHPPMKTKSLNPGVNLVMLA